MAAAWACALEFSPAKVTVVLDKSTKTRKIIENSGYFALQIPTLKQLEMVYSLGTLSLYNDPNKLEQSGVQLFKFVDQEIPVVEGCAAWILCELISEPHNQQPMTCLLVRSLPLMPMIGCSVTGTGTIMKSAKNGKVFIMSLVATSIPLAKLSQ